jgi:hypothetical protein
MNGSTLPSKARCGLVKKFIKEIKGTKGNQVFKRSIQRSSGCTKSSGS